MKKIFAVLMAVLIITAALASCSTLSMGTSDVDYAGNGSAGGYMDDGAEAPQAPDAEEGMDSGKGDNTGLTESNIADSLSEKIIYSLYAYIETTEFNNTLSDVNMLMDQYNAFIQSSSIGGNSYYDNTTYRTAEFVIRVPVENFSALKGSLGLLGNVVNENADATNITAQFTDVEARLTTYRTEEDRLLAMLEKADTVEDMITIESRLSDVRYQIESLTATLRNWQNEVDYSTVTLSIREVEELSTQVSAQRTYWERMWDGLQSTFDGIGDFFKSLFMSIVVALPVLVILGVIAVVVVVIVRATRKRKARTNKPGEPDDESKQ